MTATDVAVSLILFVLAAYAGNYVAQRTVFKSA